MATHILLARGIANMVWKIDEIDRKILEILREDARIPNGKIGKRVGLSEPAARRRVNNLASRGIIRRFTVDIAESGGVSAVVFLATSPDVEAGKLIKSLCKEEGVSSVWEISGEMDIALMLSAPDMESFNRRVDEMRAIGGIKKTQTNIVMKKWQ